MDPLISPAELDELREIAESQMLDTCVITRKGTGNGPWNESTGQYDPPDRETIYDGKCKVQIKSAVASSTETTAGERQATVQDDELQLPVVGTEEVAVKDVATILTAASDSSLVDRQFTIAARHEKSQATARRLRVREGTA